MNAEWFLEQKQQLMQLVLAVYRVAGVLEQKGEGVLAIELKKQTNRILRLFVGTRRGAFLQEEKLAEIEVLQSFFAIARAQNLIKELNFIILDREFRKFKNEILTEQKRAEAPKNRDFGKAVVVATRRRLVATKIEKQQSETPTLNERQKKLMSVIKKKKEISMADVSDMFKGQVSDKTVRRDLIDLINKDFIGRKGDKRWTKYYMKHEA